MPAALPLKQPIKVSQLVRRRLRELSERLVGPGADGALSA